MKVLYIANYKDGTGWGNAAIDYILAMDSAGLDVTCRSITFNQANVEIPARIIELENKPNKDIDVCIQHTLPHMYDYNGSFKNIAIYYTETSNFNQTNWTKKINSMDEAWVCNNSMVESSRNSGVTVPIKVIPQPCNTEKYNQKYKEIEIPNANGKFVFYFIGELIRRKNITSLLKAFHLEFSPEEPVELLLKCHKTGLNEEECGNQLKELCNTVKDNLKLYTDRENYKKELITTGRLDDSSLMALHEACHCFVMPSFGEAWCLPAFDAMAMGNAPICNAVGGPLDYLSHGGGVLVEGAIEPVFGMTETFNDLYTGRENWKNVNILELQKQMRIAYENWKKDDTTVGERGKEVADHYRYERIGNIIKETLNGF